MTHPLQKILGVHIFLAFLPWFLMHLYSANEIEGNGSCWNIPADPHFIPQEISHQLEVHLDLDGDCKAEMRGQWVACHSSWAPEDLAMVLHFSIDQYTKHSSCKFIPCQQEYSWWWLAWNLFVQEKDGAHFWWLAVLALVAMVIG